MFAILPLFAAAFAFLVSTKGSNAQGVANCAQTYTVRPGDTCNGIAAANSVSTYECL